MNDGPSSRNKPTPPDQSGSSLWRRLANSIGLGGAPRTHEDLKEMLDDALEDGLVDADAAQMIEGVFETRELAVRDIMIPRAQMVGIDYDLRLDEVLAAVVESGHSRYPVFGETRDEVVGILLAKDLLKFTNALNTFDLNRVMRQAVMVPESKKVNLLLKDFRRSRNHMAIVVDEYGGISGLVTIEDILEQIVGAIDDEHDDAEGALIVKQDERRFLVNALTPIDEFNEAFGVDFSAEEVDTVGGIVIQHFGRMPRRGESISIGPLMFSVQRADSRRVHSLQVLLSAD